MSSLSPGDDELPDLENCSKTEIVVWCITLGGKLATQLARMMGLKSTTILPRLTQITSSSERDGGEMPSFPTT